LRIILDVRQTSEGRFEGALRVHGSPVARTFDGIIELVGLLEACLADSPDVGGISGSRPPNPGGPPDGARPGPGLAFE
jgi:hypothetical protein